MSTETNEQRLARIAAEALAKLPEAKRYGYLYKFLESGERIDQARFFFALNAEMGGDWRTARRLA